MGLIAIKNYRRIKLSPTDVAPGAYVHKALFFCRGLSVHFGLSLCVGLLALLHFFWLCALGKMHM